MINERVQGCIADTLTLILPLICKPSRQSKTTIRSLTICISKHYSKNLTI